MSKFAADCSSIPLHPTPIQLNGRFFLRINSYYLFVCEKPRGFQENENDRLVTKFELKNKELNPDYDSLLFENFSLDRFYLPFICIFRYDIGDKEVFLRLHDPFDVLIKDPSFLDMVNPTVTSSTPISLGSPVLSPSSTNGPLHKKYGDPLNACLDGVQNLMELRLFEAKNQDRIGRIIKKKQMEEEALVGPDRCEIFLIHMNCSG